MERQEETATVFREKHYTVGELAEMLSLSDDSIRRTFEKEPGVLIFTEGRRSSRRVYRTLRIPEHVFERVYKRLSGSA
jgi:hypothetical protein